MHPTFLLRCAAIAGMLFSHPVAMAQNPLDRADPLLNERTLPTAPAVSGGDKGTIGVERQIESTAPSVLGEVRPMAIMINGTEAIPPTAFTQIIADYAGRSLGREDLASLASAVARRARELGYPLATANIGSQAIENSVLRVTLNEGKIDAVRVIGARSLTADKILTRHLATGKPIRTMDLERAILRVEDIPGISVRQSQFMRSEGFGIFLVTIEEDHVSTYIQVDNRGSDEVGPIRSTIVANLRGAIQSGDELSVITAQTPLNPQEFNFGRVRYNMPVGSSGGTIGLFGSFGLAKPGAGLKPLDVSSKSYDLGISYNRNLMRSRRSSLAIGATLRHMRSQQTISGLKLRDERLTVLDATLAGASALGGGVLRGEFRATAGLPLFHVSKQGDLLLSRRDGDARFVSTSYMIEWNRDLAGGLGVALSSAGQIASRPLLATAEIGLGGPIFARAYDFSERSGDKGLLGSAELRYDLRRSLPRFMDRAEGYASVDGGAVSNLRGGQGGGALLSSSAGLRIGKGRMGLAAELSFPLNKTRFDSGNRAPRLFVRISRAF